MKNQLPLPLSSVRDLEAEPFFASVCNADALGRLNANWSGALALVGPEGSGKTHLATHWRAGTEGKLLEPGEPPGSASALVIEHADAWADPEQLFHLLNRAQAGEIRLLLTARRRPSAWPSALPDLRSRLNALPVAELFEPDDALLAQVLRALFKERFILPADDLIPFLLRRIERSFSAAREVVDRLHAAGLAQGREVNRALAARELEVADVINDLFDDRV